MGPTSAVVRTLVAWIFFLPYSVWLWNKLLLALVSLQAEEAGYLPRPRWVRRMLVEAAHNDEEEETMKMLDPRKPHRFVPKCIRESKDIPPDRKAIFLVRPLTKGERADIQDKIVQGSGLGQRRKEEYRTGTMMLETLRTGLMGWENLWLQDPDDLEKWEAVPYDKAAKEKMLDLIPNRVADELANYILDQAEPDRGE